MNWPLVYLPDICRPKQWPTIQKSEMDDSGYPVYGANGIIGYYSDYNHEDPTILVTCRGATCGTINVCCHKSYVTGNAMALDNLDSNRADLSFVTRALENTDFSGVITGVAQPQITRQSLSRLQIPLPPLAEQKRIAAILDAADALRAKRRESLTQLDTLLQATFLDMFGDPVTNPKGWDVDSLTSFGSFKNGLNFNKGESGVRVRYLGVGDFGSLSKITDVESLSLIDLNQLPSEEYFLRNGDLVFVRSNGNKQLVGRCIVISPGDENVTYSGFCIRYRVEDDGLVPSFLSHLFRVPTFRRAMLQGGQGANIQNINQKILSNLEIPVPPSPLQQRFAAIVESAERQKARLRAHLAELDTLFSSLQQRAFNGEL